MRIKWSSLCVCGAYGNQEMSVQMWGTFNRVWTRL